MQDVYFPWFKDYLYFNLKKSFLTLSQTTNFNLNENGSNFSKRVENTVGKREIARYEQFLFFLQCFQKTYTADT